MRRLICAFVVCIWHKQVFSWYGSFVGLLLFSKAGLWGSYLKCLERAWNLAYPPFILVLTSEPNLPLISNFNFSQSDSDCRLQTWVVLPQPVSPEITTTWFLFIMSKISCNKKWANAQQNQHNDLYAQQGLSLPIWSVFAVPFFCSYGPQFSSRGQWRLIRLGRCQGWSESLLGAQVSLLVLSCCCSYNVKNIFKTI